MLAPHAACVTGLHRHPNHQACTCPRGHTAMGNCLGKGARYDGERNAQGQKHGRVRAYQMQLLPDWHAHALGCPPTFHLRGRPAILGRDWTMPCVLCRAALATHVLARPPLLLSCCRRRMIARKTSLASAGVVHELGRQLRACMRRRRCVYWRPCRSLRRARVLGCPYRRPHVHAHNQTHHPRAPSTTPTARRTIQASSKTTRDTARY